MNEPSLQHDAVTVEALTTGYGDVPVVRGASMRFKRGIITTIAGSNGAGKSTVIKAVAGLLRPWDGRIHVLGQDVTREPAHRRVTRGLAYVPQGRIVVPEMTVRENLLLGAHTLKGDRQAILKAMDKVVSLFPVVGERMGQLAGNMSGGEQQMVAISRALMTSPSVIVLDEPSLGLSPKFVTIVFDQLQQLRAAGYTVVMVEQKASRALAVSDEGYVMHLGQVAFQGRAADLLVNDDVKRVFLGEVPDSLAHLAREATS